MAKQAKLSWTLGDTLKPLIEAPPQTEVPEQDTSAPSGSAAQTPAPREQDTLVPLGGAAQTEEPKQDTSAPSGSTAQTEAPGYRVRTPYDGSDANADLIGFVTSPQWAEKYRREGKCMELCKTNMKKYRAGDKVTVFESGWRFPDTGKPCLRLVGVGVWVGTVKILATDVQKHYEQHCATRDQLVRRLA